MAAAADELPGREVARTNAYVGGKCSIRQSQRELTVGVGDRKLVDAGDLPISRSVPAVLITALAHDGRRMIAPTTGFPVGSMTVPQTRCATSETVRGLSVIVTGVPPERNRKTPARNRSRPRAAGKRNVGSSSRR